MKIRNIIGGILAAGAGAAAYVYCNPGIIIGKIQDVLYNGKPINSFSPFGESGRRIKENGQLYVTELPYGTEYPNSFLDISYPNEDITVDRPTVIYFHGGGYFGGDKAAGDPMAADDDANRMLNEIVSEGYNLVNVNYALVPDCRFPVPLIQMNQAIAYLRANARVLGLNMENIVIFGQSAGAILAAQYGSLLANSEYRKLLGITPCVSSEQVKALIIDDAPLRPEHFNIKLKLMIGHYMNSMNMKGDMAKAYNAYRYITEGYCSCFLTAGNTDGFPKDMSAIAQRLDQVGAECEYYFVPKTLCALHHGYLGSMDKNTYARECLDMVDDEKKPLVIKQLKKELEAANYHLNTGFLTTVYLLPTLCDHGMTEEAFRILEQTTAPGWLHPVIMGATTMLENWNGMDLFQDSFNHYSFGAVCQFLFEYVAGIQPTYDAPGFRKVVLKPTPGGSLTWAKGEYKTKYGMYSWNDWTWLCNRRIDKQGRKIAHSKQRYF